jgi:peptidoglycan/xylan/chitin deacetylase (PgdA/CDA1 family)
MRSAVTRIAVLLAGILVVSLVAVANARFSPSWVAAGGAPAGPIAQASGAPSTAAVELIESPRPTGVPSAGPSSPNESTSPSQSAWPSPPPSGAPVITTAPPPPRHEAAGCRRPPSNIRQAPVLSHGDQHEKVVALTFDDGFDATNTTKILGILKRYHVNATFFPTGRAVLQAPELWRDIAAAGFPIADHTFSHPTMSDLCYGAQLTELKRQARAVHAAVGIRVQPYMRPPYEAWNRTTRIATTAAGQLAVVIWNIDTRDWAGSTVKTITRRALHGDSGAIVLMHTTVGDTAIALPDIIRGYRTRGFRFVTIGQMLGIEGPVPYG